jgi:glycosyltransferase involved in cell wall biosynthesis
MQANENFDSVICFGGEDWWYHNRAHIDMQLMRRFAKTSTVIYINSIVMQKPNLKEGRKFIEKLKRKAKSIFTGLKMSDAGFWVYSPFALPVHHISWAKGMNNFLLLSQIKHFARKLKMKKPIVWVACPAACEAALKLKKVKLIYQRTDKYEEYPGVDGELIKSFDRKLKQAADLTIYVNENLMQSEKADCKKAIYLDHGVDFEMFANAQDSPTIPEDIKTVKKPIIGFYGGFAEHTTDIKLLAEVVEMMAEYSFVFVGQPSKECECFNRYKNVSMLGKKSYEEIPHYGKMFDVTIMPWNQNKWIESCNPIKLKEYLALGKPIVTTPFSELKKYENLVYIARNACEFKDAILKALNENSKELAAKRQQAVMPFTWDAKAANVINELFGNK